MNHCAHRSMTVTKAMPISRYRWLYKSVWHIIGILNSLEHIICILCCIVVFQNCAAYSAPNLITKCQKHKILLYVQSGVWFHRWQPPSFFDNGKFAFGKAQLILFNSLIIKGLIMLASEEKYTGDYQQIRLDFRMNSLFEMNYIIALVIPELVYFYQ